MPDIAHVAYVDTTTGQINRIDLVQAVNPQEGVSTANSSEYIVYIYSDYEFPVYDPEHSMLSNFMEKYYWSFSSSSWEYRGPPPNKAGVWTGTEWTYDVDNWLGYVRFLRDNKLAVTDWTQLTDTPFTENEKSLIRQYRQALREIPQVIIDDVSREINTESKIPWPQLPDCLAQKNIP